MLVKLATFDPKDISTSAAWLFVMLAASLFLYKQRQNNIAAVALFSACLIIVIHGLASPLANHAYNLKTFSEKMALCRLKELQSFIPENITGSINFGDA